jgi:hypothetical protein
MSIVNPGDSGPRVPAVFDDRVIFGYPEPAQQAPPPPPPQKSGGSAVAAAFGMFFIMLIPCAILGWLVYDLNSRVSATEGQATVALETRITELTTANASKDSRIVELEQEAVRQRNTLAQQRELIASFSPSIRAQLEERQARVERIAVLLSAEPGGESLMPANLRTIPPWDTEGVRILTAHNRALEDFENRRRAMMNLPPAQPYRPGEIRPGGD